MRIQNLSEVYSTRELMPLIEFVEARSPYSSLCTLVIDDREVLSGLTVGNAWKYGSGSARLDLVAPAVVRISISRNLFFPRKNSYPHPEIARLAGEVIVHSMEEEFVLVLSHELAHVWEYFGYCLKKTDIENEVMAEEKAKAILRAFRHSRS